MKPKLKNIDHIHIFVTDRQEALRGMKMSEANKKFIILGKDWEMMFMAF